MNKTIGRIMIFLAGAGFGALVTYKLVKDKYEAIAGEEIEAMQDFFISSYASDLENVKDINYADGADDTEYDEVRGGTTGLVYKKIPRERVAYDKIFKKEETDVNVKQEDLSPHVISVDEFSDGAREHDKLTISYYEEDDTLVDDQEEVIPNVEEIVGDALLRFGEGSDDEDIVYVRNARLGIDYEVVRMHKSYQETVLGFTHEETKKRRKGLNERE